MTSVSPWRDYARSRAVLLGAWDYTQLRPVPAARKSLDRMVGLLTGRLCGWPADHVLTLRNVAERGTVPDQLMQVFDGVTDVALFYFVGHGQLHGDELCLALRESPKNGARRLTTGLPFSDVRAALRECDARTKIVILDCCFSGTATLPQHTLTATAAGEDKVDVIDKASGTGAFTMAASGAYQTAWHEPDQSTDAPETYFTKYLIDTVEQGVPDHPEDLSLRVIFDRTAIALARDRRPQPTRSVRDDADRFLLARNAAMLPPTPAKRPTHQRLGLSPSPTTTLDVTTSTQVRPNATPPARPRRRNALAVAVFIAVFAAVFAIISAVIAGGAGDDGAAIIALAAATTMAGIAAIIAAAVSAARRRNAICAAAVFIAVFIAGSLTHNTGYATIATIAATIAAGITATESAARRRNALAPGIAVTTAAVVFVFMAVFTAATTSVFTKPDAGYRIIAIAIVAAVYAIVAAAVAATTNAVVMAVFAAIWKAADHRRKDRRA
jgi:Caspase domain